MNGKLSRLILTFSILFIVLVGIQVYFISNTYQLKRREIIEDVKQSLSSLEDDVDIFDKSLLKDNEAQEAVWKVEKKQWTESDLRSLYARKAKSVEAKLTRYVDSTFAEKGYKVGVMKEFVNVISRSTNRPLIQHPLLIYKTSTPVSKKYLLTSGKWETSYNSTTTTDDKKTKISSQRKYSYHLVRKTYFEINNLKWVVFKDLLFLIITSLLILTAVLILFYLTYKNLLRQRKQIDVLHDMMDNISHELKTPIATLKIASKTLAHNTDSQVVQVIGRQVDRLENMLQPIMQQERRDELTYWTIADAKAFVSDFQLAHPMITLEVEQLFDHDLKLDKYDIETILTNLLNNSIKYGAKSVSLSFELNEGLVKIIVKDDGVGIDKVEQPYIFEKFYRIQKDNIHDTKGLGLGLYIVKQIVSKYKGEVTVLSELSKGAAFRISLPYEV
ncbi:sensor histidine kinase [Sphingobacterium spiritivorum]|uniref:sensor histidine kinase n=1 Tax=Sphingobacterium spiritivorum TaxID=258 RepID=UPI003DA2C4A3